jgi:preprotein translocase subunit SecB
MPESPPEQKGPPKYPIQANFISVRELYIKSHIPPNQRVTVDSAKFILKTAHSSYDEVRHVIEVGSIIEYGIETKPDEIVPYSLRAHIMGQFKVDEAQFKKEKIDLWARINAPYILYPYLREHVFALTARSGFDPVLLPLVELPTVKIQQPPPIVETPIVAERDENLEALRNVESATDSEPVKGEELVESEELKRQFREAKERLASESKTSAEDS